MKKFTSRKFIVAIAGIMAGFSLILNGQTLEGAITVISSIVTYCVAEGYIDSKTVNQIPDAVDKTNEVIKDVVDEVNKNLADN